MEFQYQIGNALKAVTSNARAKSFGPLIVLELMKMEISITAPWDGRVAKMLVTEGQKGRWLIGLKV